MAESEANSLLVKQMLTTANDNLKEEIEALEQEIEQLKPQAQVGVPPKGNG